MQLAPQEQFLVQLIKIKEQIIRTIDSLRPKIIFRHDIDYYRSLIYGEVYVDELIRALRPPGKVVLTY